MEGRTDEMKKGYSKWQTEDREYTTDDIEALPEGSRVELIDGVLYDMAEPTTTHQDLAAEIYFRIRSFKEEHPEHCRDCRLFCPSPGVYLTEDRRTYVVPDVLAVCDPQKVEEKGVIGAPDLAVEIVSLTRRGMDYIRKQDKYFHNGVRIYWIVDPLDETVSVYDYEKNDMQKYSFSDPIPLRLCEGLSIDLSAFAGKCAKDQKDQ